MQKIRHRMAIKKCIFHALLIFAVLLFASGCAGKKRPPEIHQSANFDTKELANGIKLFTYSTRERRPSVKPITSVDQGGRGNRGGGQRPEKDTEKSQERFKKAMLQDPRVLNYCPKGVLIIEQHSVNRQQTIRGECK